MSYARDGRRISAARRFGAATAWTRVTWKALLRLAAYLERPRRRACIIIYLFIWSDGGIVTHLIVRAP